MNYFSLGQMAAHLASASADMKDAQEAAVMKGAEIIAKTAKGVMGTPQPLWPPLQPETIERKAHGNTPLLETGELRDSIKIAGPFREPGEVAAYVYSTDKKAVFHELGTKNIPPRSFLQMSAMGKEREIHEMAQRLMIGAVMRGGAHYRELRELIHLMHELKHKVEELAPERR